MLAKLFVLASEYASCRIFHFLLVLIGMSIKYAVKGIMVIEMF